MGLFRKVAGYLGFGNHDLHEVNREDKDENDGNNVSSVEEIHHHDYSHLRRKGFSVPVQVSVDRAHQIGPILVPCATGDGGVQGLGWYTRRLRIDEDGDVADEFIDEIFTETSSNNMEVNHKPFSKFEVKLTTKPAKARNPFLSRQGTIQQHVEFRGKLRLV